MSYLRKRGLKGTFWLYYYDKGKKVGISTHTSDKQAAQNFKTRKDHSLLSKKSRDLIPNAYWKNFCEDYLSFSQSKKRPRSVQRDRATIRIFNKTCPIKYFSEFTFTVLNDYKTIRKKDGVKESTINRELSTLKNMGRIAPNLKYCEINPVVGVPSYPEIEVVKDRYLNKVEINLVLSKIKSIPIKTMCYLGLYAGFRLGESIHLTWDDVDFEKNMLYITPKDGWQPKTYRSRAGRQFVPLSAKLKAYLLNLRHYGKWVCSYEDGSKTYEESACSMIRKIFHKLGLKDCTSHTLRHTFLSWLAMSGVDMFPLSQLARHTDPKMTLRYAHLHPDFQKDNVNKLPY